MSFDDSLLRTARRLREKAVVNEADHRADLRTRTLKRIAESGKPNISRYLWKGALVRASGVVCILCLIAATAIALPHVIVTVKQLRTVKATPLPSYMIPVNLSPEAAQFVEDVNKAVSHAVTWHIRRWTRDASSPSHMEIWGRANPYMVRVNEGDDVTIDDGKTVQHLFDLATESAIHPSGKSNANKVQGGRVLTLTNGRFRYSPIMVYTQEHLLLPKPSPSVGATNDDWNKVSRDISIGGIKIRSIARVQSAGNSLDSEGLLTRIDTNAATHLPRQFLQADLRRDAEETAGQEFTAFRGTLTEKPPLFTVDNVSYNVPLPAHMDTIVLPLDTQVVDCRVQNTSATPTVPTTYKTPFTVRLFDVAQDAEGNVHLRIDLYQAEHRYTGEVLTRLSQAEEATMVLAQDDRNRVYSSIVHTAPGVGSHISVWLAPETPYLPGDPRPTHLTLYFPMSATRVERSALSRQWIVMQAPLPGNLTRLSALTSASGTVIGRTPYHSLQELAAVARATFCDIGTAGTVHKKIVKEAGANQSLSLNPSATEVIITRGNDSSDNEMAIRWWDIAAKEAEAAGDHAGARSYRYHADQKRQVK